MTAKLSAFEDEAKLEQGAAIFRRARARRLAREAAEAERAELEQRESQEQAS